MDQVTLTIHLSHALKGGVEGLRLLEVNDEPLLLYYVAITFTKLNCYSSAEIAIL